jgi:FkbM family methyltransferase
VPAAEALGDEISTIVDLGANTGLVARWFLERFPAARIVSVEPEPTNVEILRMNLAPYGERAQLIAACIGAHERSVALDTSKGEFGVMMVELDDPEIAGDARVITMDSVLSALGSDNIDLLKCDVEGAEEELFQAGGDWISRVNVMSVECHRPFTPDRLVALLEEGGYEVEKHHLESTLDYGAETLTFSLRRIDAA